MKESIGALQIFAICMVLIVLFTSYIAISVNYSKAFNIKSYIVSAIEENSGWNGLEDDVKTYLTSQGYTAYGKCPEKISGNDLNLGSAWSRVDVINDYAPSGKYNVCIYKLETTASNNDFNSTGGYYYKVITFYKFDLPIINTLLTFKVSGDTKYIGQ